MGDLCFHCECRVATIAGDDAMTLAWCECEWPADAHDMEVFSSSDRAFLLN